MHHGSPPRSPALLLHRRQLLAAVVLAAGAGCSRQAPTPAPEVAYTLLDGSPGRVSALQGQVVLVNFWATSCGVCVQEMPMLAATRQKYAPRGFELLAVAMQWDAPARVAQFASARALGFPVVIDNTGAVAQAFGGIQATPTNLLLDRQGLITQRWTGALHEADLHARIERLLEAA